MFIQRINDTEQTAADLPELAKIAATTDGSTGYPCAYFWREEGGTVRELTAEEWSEFGNLCEAEAA